jgi:hypothetical protein
MRDFAMIAYKARQNLKFKPCKRSQSTVWATGGGLIFILLDCLVNDLLADAKSIEKQKYNHQIDRISSVEPAIHVGRGCPFQHVCSKRANAAHTAFVSSPEEVVIFLMRRQRYSKFCD